MESCPAVSTVPKTARRAPVARPRVAAASGSPRPRHRRMTTVGDTVRSGPAPSRSRDSTSTSPSRHSWSFGSNTSNGATAMRFGSRAARACDREMDNAPSAAAAAASPLPGAPMLATLRGADGETLQRIGDEPGQPGALCIDPVFELGRSVRMVEVNAVEERADVQRDGALELRAGERGLQIRDVAIDKGRVEAQVGGAEEEVVGAQLATQGGQRLRQRMPGVLRVALGPEEGEQAVAADTPLSPRREHGEQRQLAALRRRPGDRTALTGEREPAEGP